MPLVVEDGTGLATADAYVTIAEVQAYAANFGGSFTGSISDLEAAIRRATAYIDARYGDKFGGNRRRLRLQALVWPRSGAYDRDRVLIDSDKVPVEIDYATCIAAMRELSAPNSLNPDYERGGAVQRLKAGSVEVEYASGASPETIITAIDSALAGIIGSGSVGGGITSIRTVNA